MSKPIVFYDLETTGIDRDSNNIRIVEISAIKVDKDTLEELGRIYYKCNNGDVHISPSATEKHGITEEDVKDLPTFQEVAPKVFEFFDGCDLGGYYCTFYDNSVLYMSFMRAGINWNYRELKIYDIYTLYKKYNTGKLVDVYKKYTGKELVDAHEATADITATLEVYKEQRKLGEEFDESDLYVYKDHLDLAGNFKIRTNERGAKEVYIDFGKWKGKSIDQVDKAYFAWMMKSGDTFPLDTRKYAQKIYERKGGS